MNFRAKWVNGAPDRGLITRELQKDELKLSNFTTKRDDFIYHEISRKLHREFASVLHDECRENLRKTKSEHFLDQHMPNFHTYRLGGSNYLTASVEVAYFYKCRPQLVAAIRAQTCYDALPVEVAQNNYPPTSFTGWRASYCSSVLHRAFDSSNKFGSQKGPLSSAILCKVQRHLRPMVRCNAPNLNHGSTSDA